MKNNHLVKRVAYMTDKAKMKSIHSRFKCKSAQYQASPNHICKQRELNQQQANHCHSNCDQGDIATMYPGEKTSESKIELSKKAQQIVIIFIVRSEKRQYYVN